MLENGSLMVAVTSPEELPLPRPSFVLPPRGRAKFLSAGQNGGVRPDRGSLLLHLRGRMVPLVIPFHDDRDLSIESIFPAVRLRRELRIGDSASVLIAEAVALELIAQMCRSDGAVAETEEAWVRELRARVTRNLTAPFPIDEAATAMGMTSAQLLRVFRRATGESLGEYRRRQQIHVAIELLLETALSMQEIAYRAGFYDQAHFTRVFKQSVGATPSSFRRHSETTR